MGLFIGNYRHWNLTRREAILSAFGQFYKLVQDGLGGNSWLESLSFESHDETPDSSGIAGGALQAGGLPAQGRGTLARGKAGSVMKQLIWAEIVPPLDRGDIERRRPAWPPPPPY